MAHRPLLLPDLGFAPLRSEIAWQLPEGAPVAPRQPVASVAISSESLARVAPRGTEVRALLLAPTQGTLHPHEMPSSGWDAHFPRKPWEPGHMLGTLETARALKDAAALALQVALFSIDRLHPAFEDRRPFPGGPCRLLRAWWGPSGWSEPCRTVLSLGNCEQLGFFAGNAGDLAAWLEALPGPISVVYKPDRITVPSAAALLSALEMDDTARRRAAEEFGAWFRQGVQGAAAGDPSGWLGTAAVAQELLGTTVLRRSFAVVDGAGRLQEHRPDCVFLSLASEFSAQLRHRKLGYTISVPAFQFGKNPDIRQTLLGRFELMRPSVAETQHCLKAVIARIRQETGARVVVFNATSFVDRVWDWSAVDRPNDVPAVRTMDLNLALWELARQDLCELIDVEALALDLGLGAAYPDGIHPSSALEARVRARIFERLRQA